MAETKNTEKQNIEIQKEEEKRESVRKADAAVKSMHDFTSPEVLYQELIKSVKKYHPSTDISMIEKAYKVASEAHKDQKRKSGEPYIIHPLCVAIILADLELDKETIVGGLLHDKFGTVILGHLSKENNYEELAYEAVRLEVTMGENPYKADDFPMLVAKRDSVSPILRAQ